MGKNTSFSPNTKRITHLLCLMLLLLAGIPSRAAFAWQFVDGFNTDSSSSYTQYGDSFATWTWDTSNSRLIGNGGKNAVLAYNYLNASDVAIEVEVNRVDDGGIVARFKDNSNYYLLTIYDDSSSDLQGQTENVKIWKRVNGQFTALKSKDLNFTRGTLHRVRFELQGTLLTVYFDGNVVLSVTDSSITSPGKVGLRNGAGISQYYSFAVQTGDADATPPAAPVGLTATATGPTSVQLTWLPNGEQDLSGYKVYRDGIEVADVPPTATTWTDTNVQPGTQYTYTLKAYDTAGNFSDPSAPATVTTPAPADTTPPAAPAGLTASQVNYNSVTLTWAANTEPDLAGYKVYRNGTEVAQVTGTSWQDTGVSPQTTYTYEVRAYDQAGNLSSPASIAVTTPAAPPDPPRAELTAVTNTSITISWTPPAQNVRGYRIYADGQLVDTVPPDQTTYTLAGLEGGRAYEVWVTSYNDAGESAPSNVIKSTPSFLSLARLGDMLENLWMLFKALWPLIAFVLALLAMPHLIEIVKQTLRRRRAY